MGVHRRRTIAGPLTFIVTLACSSVISTAPAAHAAAEVKINHWGTGAVAAYGTCVPQPNGDILCNDYIVFYGSGGSARDGVARGPAVLQFGHNAALIHPDGTVDDFVVESSGYISNVSGAYDRSRLTFARVAGATLDLYDIDPVTGDLSPNGRTVTLGPFEWTAASGVYVFGNDGPFGFGLPRHYVDHCVTEVSNGHERFTTAHVTGTIDGVSVENFGGSYLPWPGTSPDDARGAIFDNTFTVREASHAPNC